MMWQDRQKDMLSSVFWINEPRYNDQPFIYTCPNVGVTNTSVSIFDVASYLTKPGILSQNMIFFLVFFLCD